MEFLPVLACLMATVGLLAIAYDLGHETPDAVRWLVVGIAFISFGVGLKTLNNPGHYQEHASIGFTCIGILKIALFIYLKAKPHISLTVVRTSSLALFIAVIAGVAVVSCGKTQKVQQPTQLPDSVFVMPSRQELQDEADWDSLRNLH